MDKKKEMKELDNIVYAELTQYCPCCEGCIGCANDNGYCCPTSRHISKTLTDNGYRKVSEGTCVICHKDISTELPKIDVYGNRYCSKCYSDKCRKELLDNAQKETVNKIKRFVENHTALSRDIEELMRYLDEIEDEVTRNDDRRKN